MNPEQWRESGGWVRVNGQRVFYRVSGDGLPVIALHAFPTSSYDYSRVAPLLTAHFRLILFDYPGYGFSDKPRGHTYSLFENADCLAAVAEHFGARRCCMLAHDIGDSVALIALARGDIAVEKLVLMNGSVLSIPFDNLAMRLTQKALLHPVIGPLAGRLGLINRAFFATTARQLFSYPLPRDELDAFWSIIKFNGGQRLYPVLMRYMLERWQHQHTWLDALAEHRAPLTLIWGQRDPIATPAVAEAVMARRADATYQRLETIGHYPHWETPEMVAEAVGQALG